MTTKRFWYTIICSLMLISPASAQVVINEYSASNYNQFFGGNSDWLELYNSGAAAFDLSGYHLSDKQTNPTKWAFPAGTTIAAGDHLLVLILCKAHFFVSEFIG